MHSSLAFPQGAFVFAASSRIFRESTGFINQWVKKDQLPPVPLGVVSSGEGARDHLVLQWGWEKSEVVPIWQS